MEARVELSTRPENKLGTDEEWDFTEARARGGARARGIEYEVERGRGRVLRPEDRPAHDRLARPLVADGHDPARRPDAAAVRAHATSGADNTEHTPYVIHRALLGSFERFIGILIEHYAGAFPFWLAPVQVRVLPVGEAHRDGGATRSRRGSREAGYRVEVDERDETVGKRIRDAEVEKIPYVVVYGDKRVRRVARRARARRRAVDASLDGSLLARSLLPLTPAKQGRTRSSPPRAERSSEVQPSRMTTRMTGRCLQRLLSFEKEEVSRAW